MKWFRFYDEALDDPKVQRLSATMFRHWVNLLCLANRDPDRGYLPPISDIAFGLRVSERKARDIVNELVAVGLIDRNEDETYEPHGWKNRQRVSDNVAERVAKHRERNRDATLHETESEQESNVTETDPHARATETDTETETDMGGDPAPPKPKTKRATQVPDVFPITSTLATWGESNGFTREQMESQVPLFQDHYRSKGEPRKDWAASFRTWMHKARKWNQLDAATPSQKAESPNLDYFGTDGLKRRAEEYRRQQAGGEA